jgi:hypothetical protein
LEDFYTNLEAEFKVLNNDSGEEQAVNKHPLVDFKAFACWRPLEDLAHVDLLNGLGT